MSRYGQLDYEVGHIVRVVQNAPWSTVTWRGWLLVPRPGTQSVLRHAVYRLDNGHWDCYYEDDLLPLNAY